MRMLYYLVAFGLTPASAYAPASARAFRTRSARAVAPVAAAVEVEVLRDPSSGSLGLDVDESNVVAGNPGQPELMLGDVITAIDGEALDGRPIGGVLTPGAASYKFSVERDAASATAALEAVLLNLAAAEPDTAPTPTMAINPADARPGLPTFDSLPKELGSKAFSVVEALEAAQAAAGPPSAERVTAGLQGWWKLVLTDSAALSAAGLSTYGASPFCHSCTQHQFFDEESRQVQTIEVVANEYPSAEHQLVVLKGEYAAQAGEGGAAPAATEKYTSLDYQGSPQPGSPPVEVAYGVSYLGERLRVCRVTGGVANPTGEYLLVYAKRDEQAQPEIEDLLATPVESSEAGAGDARKWERADQTDRSDTDGGTPLG